MTNLDFIFEKYKLTPGTRLPIEIPGTRWKDLPELFTELGFTIGAEIGVEAGRYSESLCKGIPNLTLYCIDPWKAYEEYIEHVSQEELDQLYQTTCNRLKSYHCYIIRDFSENAFHRFGNESLDFVYIDGNHEFLHVAQDIANWSSKIKKGGIVAGHDFRRNSKKYINDVKDVVPAYAYAKRINPWFVLREPVEASSWFWVKQ